MVQGWDDRTLRGLPHHGEPAKLWRATTRAPKARELQELRQESSLETLRTQNSCSRI